MSVSGPKGFVASGIVAGLKASGREDLGLLAAPGGASAAGLFTTNAFPAAPVVVSRGHLAQGRARAVIVNSGQANAGTGEDGLADALAIAEATATAVGAAPDEILVCSTGVIGPRVKLPSLVNALPVAVEALTTEGGPAFARAICTTDTVTKETLVRADGFTVGGCAKGAGMIALDLATMLAFLTTDALVDRQVLDAAVRRAVAPVFNGLTVDGCTSTNDTVLVLASGASGAAPSVEVLEAALAEAATDLVLQLQRDAEGATKALAVQVTGGATDHDADAVAKAVAQSLLVKTAIFGEDPNAGRLLQAVGASRATFEPREVTIQLAGVLVVAGGTMAPFDVAACRTALKEREVVVHVSLGDGPGEATAFGCDLGYEYVRINSEYTT